MAGRGRGRDLTVPAWVKQEGGVAGAPGPVGAEASVLGKRDAPGGGRGAGALLPGWAEADAPGGRKYWYHRETGKTSWERPVATDATAGEPERDGGEDPSGDGGDQKKRRVSAWREARAADGKVYYYNESTNETRWDRPDDFASATASTPSSARPAESAPDPQAARQAKEDEGPLAPGWREYSAPDGRKYYSHATTNETRWDRPLASEPSNHIAPAVKDRPAASPRAQGEWQPVTTADGKQYYYNRVTRETSWTVPASMATAPRRPVQVPAKSSNRKRGGGGGRKAGVVQRPRNAKGKAMRDKEAETYFISEVQRKAQKRKGFVEDSKPKIAEPTDGRKTFTQLLEDCGVSASTTWLEAMRACTGDERYLRSLRTYGQRKDAFESFVAQKKKTQRLQTALSIRKARDDFMMLLNEKLTDERDGLRSLEDCSKPVSEAIVRDSRYSKIAEEEERKRFLATYFANRDRTIREKRRLERREKMKALRSLIEMWSSTDPPKFSEVASVREMADVLKDTDEFKALTDVEADIVLDEWQRDADRRRSQRVAREREEAHAREREAREVFRNKVLEMVKMGEIAPRAQWTESSKIVLAKDWSQNSAFGDDLSKMFADVMKTVADELRDLKDRFKAVVKEKEIDIPPHMGHREFREKEGISDLLDRLVIPLAYEQTIFEEYKERQAEKVQREIRKRERAKDDLFAFLKRKEYSSCSTWEATKSEISRRTVYRELEALAGEEGVKQAFEEYVERRREKEKKKSRRAVGAPGTEDNPAPVPPPPPPETMSAITPQPSADEAAEIAKLEALDRRRQEILAKLKGTEKT